MKSNHLVKQGKHRARRAGLYYVSGHETGFARRRCGKGFTYLTKSGKTLRSNRERKRIESLAIPPAWTEVWICASANGHIQAVGWDEAGRKQYIYHPQWAKVSSSTKFSHMARFGELLPKIRRRVRQDLDRDTLDKQQVLAAVVRVLDKSHIRVGNQRYLNERGSRGATTLSTNNVEIDRHNIILDFTGKGGKQHAVEFADEKVAMVINACEEIGGQFLFSYRADDGNDYPVTSSDVNSYLHEISGEQISAKDFRTWSGSAAALSYLMRLNYTGLDSPRILKRHVRDAADKAAELLGNTRVICLSSYIHPGIVAAYENGKLLQLIERVRQDNDFRKPAELRQDEFLLSRLLPHLARHM